jgi:hypothetical protein
MEAPLTPIDQAGLFSGGKGAPSIAGEGSDEGRGNSRPTAHTTCNRDLSPERNRQLGLPKIEIAQGSHGQFAQGVVWEPTDEPCGTKIGGKDLELHPCRGRFDGRNGTHVLQGQGNSRAPIDDGVLAAEDEFSWG